MKKSNSPEINNFLEENSKYHPKKFQIISKLRNLIISSHPNFAEEFKYGGILFTHNNQPSCGIFVYKDYVSLEFSNGINFKDPDKLLEGNGKFRRHLKFREYEEIVSKNTHNFINQL